MSAENQSVAVGGTVNTRPNLLVSGVTVFALFLVVNFLGSQLRIRADLTEENLYTLSDGTRKIVGNLEEELTIRFYFSKGLPNLPRQYLGLKSFGQKVLELLQEYESLSGDINLEVIDPEPDTELEEEAQKYNLQGVPLPTKEKFYMGLVFLHAGNEKVIPMVDPSRVQYLEYDVTRTIDEVSKTKLPKLGVLSSLPVFEVMSSPFMQQPGMPQPQPGWMFVKELEKTFKIEKVDAKAEKLPEDLSVLMIVHPKDLGEKLRYAIDQFVMNGGNLITLVDPHCRSDESKPMNQQPFAEPENGSDLNGLLAKWGAEVPTGKVAASKDQGSVVNAGPQGAIQLPTWIGFQERMGLNNDLAITSQLDSLRFIEPGHVRKKDVDGVEFIPLITATGKTGTLATSQMTFGYIENAQKISFKTEDKVIAALLKGTFSSNFEKAPEGVEGEHKAKAAEEGSILVIADVDFIYDDYWVNAMNFFGHKLLRPLNDNFNLIANSVEFLAGSSALISIRSRGRFERPFTRVRALEKDAQDRFRKKEEELLATLKETEEKINQLTGAKVEDGRIILTKEQEEAVKQFREEQLTTRKELRRVRRDLRRGVVSLGTNITLFNLVAIPLLVAIFGVWAIRNRR